MGGLPVADRQHDRAGGRGDSDKAAEGMWDSYELCCGQGELLLEDLTFSVRAFHCADPATKQTQMQNLLHVTARQSAALCMQDGHAVRFLPKSAYLASPQQALVYVRTASGLLSRAHCLHSSARQNGACGQGGGGEESAKIGGALQALWPLAEGTFAAQLLQQLPREDLPLLCLLYWRLLAALPDLAPACGLSAQKEEARYVNALVRADVFLGAIISLLIALIFSMQLRPWVADVACVYALRDRDCETDGCQSRACHQCRKLVVCQHRPWAQRYCRCCGRTWRAAWVSRWRRPSRPSAAGALQRCSAALRAWRRSTPPCWASSAGLPAWLSMPHCHWVL